MAVKSGFFNSIAGDRLYDAEDVNSFFDGVIVDGVLSTIGDTLLVTAATGMQVNIGSGKAWFLKSWLINTAAKILTLSASHVSYDRIDIVALDHSKVESVRENDIIVVEGTAAASPIPPTLIDVDNHLQIPLAHILVGTGVVEIIQANITNKVGTVDCPFSQGIVDLIINVDDVTIEIVSNDLQVKDDGISTAKIASGAVDTNELATDAVTNAKIAVNAVTNAKIASGAVDTDELVADAVTNAKIASGAVDTTEIANDAITASKIDDGAVGASAIGVNAVGQSELAANAVLAANIVDGNVTLAKLAANSVDDTKAGNRVPQFYRRQGGSPTNWSTPGATTYTPGAVRMQGGNIRETDTGGNSGTVIVTFPTAFSYAPIVFVTASNTSEHITVTVFNIGTSSFIISWLNDYGNITTDLDFSWLAIGPE